MRITTLFAAILAAFTSLVHGWEDEFVPPSLQPSPH